MTTNLPTNPRQFGAVQQMETFPEWVKDLAYQLWAWSCSQNVSKVAAVMNAGTYPDDGGLVPEGVESAIAVRRQTVNGWKLTHKWEERRVKEMREFAPSIHAKVAANIVSSSLEAEAFIADLNAGRIPVPETKEEAALLKLRLDAANATLSRAGHLPHTRPNDGGALPGPTPDHANTIAGLSREEKLAMAWGNPNATTTGISGATMDASSESIIEAASPLASPDNQHPQPASPPPSRSRHP